jgi:stalled ribosome rescue protein Dom34
MKKKRGYRRGYSVALLIGFEEDRAIVWQVYSHVVKPHRTLKLDGERTNEKPVYNFHESIVNAVKPLLNEGVKSIVVASPLRTTYSAAFLDHVKKHHGYLTQSRVPKVTFAELAGSADEPQKVAELVKTSEFRRLIAETTSEEADDIIDTLEKCLSSTREDSSVLFSLKEIEDRVYSRERNKDFRLEFLMLTDRYLAESGDKNRIHRLMQIAKNRKMKTKVVNVKTPAGKRISQFGGIVFFAC